MEQVIKTLQLSFTALMEDQEWNSATDMAFTLLVVCVRLRKRNASIILGEHMEQVMKTLQLS